MLLIENITHHNSRDMMNQICKNFAICAVYTGGRSLDKKKSNVLSGIAQFCVTLWLRFLTID